MKVISRKKVDHLLHHVVDGFSASHKGLVGLRDDKIISMEEFESLVTLNVERLQVRVNEWRIAEKMICLVFASLFAVMSITNNAEDMVRSARRPSGRKSKTEQSK